ncbi:hypothetical protein QUG92_11180 [Curtobacterium sp. RHCKG23]|uniref:Uncharacterized protein n=1 Tax=Curtobacterium citri TaxID=3055139 RepID=A0ABT7T7Y3_9MICO|nr:hypothetical protein [Curtobacterium citri]MDM7885666.1 hypothetical protein [Curtobacterium citri]
MQNIRHEQAILSLPFGLGYTIDITQTLAALAAAGMPARVEAFDRLRFDDGRTAFLATPDPTTTVTDDDVAKGRSDDVILLPGGSEGGVLSLVRRYPDLVVVNGKRGRVWADGRQVSGTSMQREATTGWRTVFAIARSIIMHGGGTRAIADQTGIPSDEVRAAMQTLGSHVFHTPIGWEARDRPALCDWAYAAYPGYGGVRTCWRRDDTIDAQADQLIGLGGVMSDRWAAQQSGVLVTPDRLTAFFAQHPDMAALGYVPASADDATVKVVIPQDPTVLTAAEGCCTDDFITGHVLYEAGWVTVDADAVNGLRQLLHFRSDLAHDLRWHPGGSSEGRVG